MYVDELLNEGDHELQIHTRKILETFKEKPRIYDHFNLYGEQIKTLHDGSLYMSQRYYAKTLKTDDVDGSFEKIQA